LSRHQELVRDYQIRDIYARLTKVEHDFLNYFNSKQEFRQRLSCTRPAKAEDGGCIDFHLNLTADLLKPGSQRVFLPTGSNIPQLLQSLADQETAHEISDIEQPAVASIVYGIASIHYYATYEVPDSGKQSPYDPWAILEDNY
jgi:hypothetical protein